MLLIFVHVAPPSVERQSPLSRGVRDGVYAPPASGAAASTIA